MRKGLIGLILLMFVTSLPADEMKMNLAHPKDSWTGFDKWQHFSFSLLITVQSGYALSHDTWVFQPPDRQNRMISAGVSPSFGVLKEIMDMRRKPSGFFSWKDLVMDVGGTLTGVLILDTICNDH